MNWSRAVQVTYFLLRVVAGLLFLQHGAAKWFDWFSVLPDASSPPPPPFSPPALLSLVGIAGILELAGGFLILVGLFTHPTAFVLSGQMAVAYWQAHAPKGTWPIQNHGEPAVLYCFLFLFMAAYGGGDWSLDALIRRRRGKGAAVPESPGVRP